LPAVVLARLVDVGSGFGLVAGPPVAESELFGLELCSTFCVIGGGGLFTAKL